MKTKFFAVIIVGFTILLSGFQPGKTISQEKVAGGLINNPGTVSPNAELFPNPVNTYTSYPRTAPFYSVWDEVPDNIRNTKAFKRFEWFYRSRLDEKGDFPVEFISRQKELEISKVRNRGNSGDNPSSFSGVWTNLGPVGIDMASSFIPYWGIATGRVRGIAVHPTDPNTLYIGAAAGGIWKSTNGGASWTDKSGQFNLITFGAIAIDKLSPNTVYAGTGETRWLYNNITFEGDGLYKTTDGGDTWTKITNGFGTRTQFSDVEVSPTNSNIVLAALGSGNWNNQNVTNQGVWRSTDAGITWNRVINSPAAFDVAFHPTNGNLAFASTGDQRETGGFFKSTDAGATWIQSNTGLPDLTSIGRIQFDISRSNPSVIYSYIFNSSVISGGRTTCAYKSTNAGSTWEQISYGDNIAGSYNGTTVSDQGSYDLCIAVNPSNASNVFFGNVELSRTDDGSAIYFVRNPAGYSGGNGAWDCPAHVDIHKINFAPSNSSVIYVGCDGGVYRSTNAGSTFTHVNTGINAIQFYRVASHPTNSNILYGGAQDNGNFSTQNKGATSWVFTSSGDGMECFVDYNNGNNVFSSTQNGSLKRSTNGGANWSEVFSSPVNTTWCAPYWQHPTQPAKIYAALSRKIYMSTSGGDPETWSAISSDITTNNRITSVAHSRVNTNYMMSAASNYTTSPGVYKSTDEGVSWTEITENISFTGANIQRVVADPVNANTYYITRASYTTAQVIKTTDFGITWTDISAGLPAVSANTFFVDPVNTNHVFVGNDFGVYWSSTGGTGWTKLSNGFPFVPVLDFSYFNSGGIRLIRAATHGRGVFEINADAVGINQISELVPASYSLKQNYPNPFNPSTNIRYDLPKNSFVKLVVFDMLGKEIETLVNENQSAGTYETKFDASRLSSGVYFYRIETGNFVDVKRMLLIK